MESYNDEGKVYLVHRCARLSSGFSDENQIYILKRLKTLSKMLSGSFLFFQGILLKPFSVHLCAPGISFPFVNIREFGELNA